MFIAYVKQEGEGCDYTIACGYELWELEAQTEEEALAELRHKVVGDIEQEYDDREEYGYWDERRLESVTLYKVVDKITAPIGLWYDEARAVVAAKAAEAREAVERMQYERLKRKFD